MWNKPQFPQGAPVGAAATPQPPTANASNGLTCITCRLNFEDGKKKNKNLLLSLSS